MKVQQFLSTLVWTEPSAKMFGCSNFSTATLQYRAVQCCPLLDDAVTCHRFVTQNCETCLSESSEILKTPQGVERSSVWQFFFPWHQHFKHYTHFLDICVKALPSYNHSTHLQLQASNVTSYKNIILYYSSVNMHIIKNESDVIAAGLHKLD